MMKKKERKGRKKDKRLVEMFVRLKADLKSAKFNREYNAFGRRDKSPHA